MNATEERVDTGPPASAPRRRAGRPRVPKEQARTHALAYRVSKESWDLIHELAKFSRRSIAREIEARVWQTIEADAPYGGPRMAIFFREMADRAHEIADPALWLDS